MKYKANPLIVVGALALLVAAYAGASSQQGSRSCCGGMMGMRQDARQADKAFLAKQFKGKQTATVVVNGGYSPSAIEVQKGKPVELTFTGGKSIGCGGTVVFKSLNISKEVATGKSVVVRFTPKEKGEIPFSCGMGMLQGKVIVK